MTETNNATMHTATTSTEQVYELMESYDIAIRYDVVNRGGFMYPRATTHRNELRDTVRRLGQDALTQIGRYIRDRYVDRKLNLIEERMLYEWKLLLVEMLKEPPTSYEASLKQWIAACFREGLGHDTDILHALLGGSPMCGFVTERVEAWPPGHKAVGVQHTDLITCPECKKLAQRT